MMVERAHVIRRRLILGGAGLAAIVAIALAIRPDPVEVEVEPVRLAPVRVTIAAEGRTRVRQRYVVTAPVTGALRRIRHVEGVAVRAGEVIAVLAPAPIDEAEALQARARVDAAVAQQVEAEGHVRVADAAARQAQRDRDRARVLQAAGAVARRELEAAELALRTRADEARAARMRAAAAAAAVREASASMLRSPDAASDRALLEIRAPASGRVLRVPDRSARVVTAGAQIMELGDVGGLEVVADVLSADAARILPGMRVVFTGWGGEQPISGQVRLVEPSATTEVSALGVEEQRVNVIIDVAGLPPTVGDGYRVDADIVVVERPPATTVPPGALVRNGSDWAVFLARDGRARLRNVQIGAMGESVAEVLDGVRLGDTVIVFPSDEIRDGVRIRFRS